MNGHGRPQLIKVIKPANAPYSVCINAANPAIVNTAHSVNITTVNISNSFLIISLILNFKLSNITLYLVNIKAFCKHI